MEELRSHFSPGVWAAVALRGVASSDGYQSNTPEALPPGEKKMRHDLRALSDRQPPPPERTGGLVGHQLHCTVTAGCKGYLASWALGELILIIHSRPELEHTNLRN